MRSALAIDGVPFTVPSAGSTVREHTNVGKRRAQNCAEIAQNCAGEDVAAVTSRFLDAAIRAHGIEVISRALDIPIGTLRGYRAGRTPNGLAAIRLTAFFGGDYTKQIIDHTRRRIALQRDASANVRARA